MAAPPRSSDGPPYERPATLYGRSATVYGRTVTDPDQDGDEPGQPEEPGFLGFVGTPEPVPGRHSAEARRTGGAFDAAGLPPVALGLAVLALLIGGIATVTGIVAVGRATTAQLAAERAASAAASAVAGAQPTVDAPQPPVSQPLAPLPMPASVPPTPPSPGPTRSADPDSLDPRADYEVAYDRQSVRVQPSTCEGTGVDLDEPRVLPPAGADAAYRTCADGFHLDFDESARYALVTGRRTSAGGCVEAIRSDPGVGWVRPTPGTTVCVLTSRLAAEPQQLSTKLARLHVEDVEADGTLVAVLTAWVVR